MTIIRSRRNWMAGSNSKQTQVFNSILPWVCGTLLCKLHEHGFEAEGLKWMPLADVDEERYHIYFVDKQLFLH